MVVRPDPARHPEEPEHVLRQERQVEADEGQPEVPLAEPLVEEPAEHLRPPVIEPAEHAEHRSAEQHVVEVRDDVVAVVDLPVDREGGKEDAGEAAHREERDEADRPEQRRIEDEVAAPHRGDPVEDLHPVGTAITIDEIMKNESRPMGSPAVNMWCAQTSSEKNAIASVENATAL